MKKYFLAILLPAAIGLASFIIRPDDKPVLYIIGDSTVRNQNTNGQWGWGTLIGAFFDNARLAVSNQAMAGRSTRTFIKEASVAEGLRKLKDCSLNNYLLDKK